MSSYLVTGGAGFIGSHIVDVLLAKGHNVRILDNLQPRVHPKGRPSYIPDDAEFIEGDVRDGDMLSRAMKGMRRIFHLAAYQDYMPDFSTFFHVNAVSPALIIELIVRDGIQVEKIVFASTQAVYGEGKYRCERDGTFYPAPRTIQQLKNARWEIQCPKCGGESQWQFIDEGTVNPPTAYAISKYSSELTFLNLARRYGIPAAGLRYSITQGPRNSFYNAYSGVCRIFAHKILNGDRPIVFEDGGQLRDYINVEDVVRATLMVMEMREADYQMFNVGGGRAVSIMEFLRVMAKVLGKDVDPIMAGEFRYGDTRHTVSGISSLRRLGWEPRVPLEESIRRYLAWLMEQPDAYINRCSDAEEDMRARGVIQEGNRR